MKFAKMERFLTGSSKLQPPQSKKNKTDDERTEARRQYERSKRVRTYLCRWETEFPFVKNTESGMVCTVCKQYDAVGPFVQGCKNYKRDVIVGHEKSEGHRLNIKRSDAKKNPTQTPSAKLVRQFNQLTISRMVFLFRNAHYLCKKGRPYTDYPNLCDLDQAKNLNIGQQYRTDKKAAEFCSLIAETERNKIREKINKAKYISVISDGTTDSSYQEAEIVYVRHCNQGKISVNFSCVQNVARGNAETITKVIIDGLTNLAGKDYTKKVVALGTDGASVMVGCKSGVVQRIREFLSKPWIVGVHCSGHKLELAYKDAIKSKIALYDKIDIFLLNIYLFYRNSNVNRSMLKESFKSLGQNVILPTRTGGTRWVGHLQTAIQCYLKAYEAMALHLGQLCNRDDPAVFATEKGNKAKGLHKLVKEKSAWYMMHFLLDVLNILVQLSKSFQLKTATVSEVLDDIKVAAENLEKLQSSDGPQLRKGIESLPADLNGNLESFTSARKKFLDGLLTALQKRFTDNPGILESSSVFNLSNLPVNKEELKGYGDEQIATLVDHFRSGLEEATVDVDVIESEWTKLKHSLLKRFDNPNQASWEDVNVKLKQVCPNILSLVDLVLTIPASSADAERGFNHVKLTKSDWRTKLTDGHLSDQLVVVLESSDINCFDPIPAINLWGTTPRRVNPVLNDIFCENELDEAMTMTDDHDDESELSCCDTDEVVVLPEPEDPVIDNNNDDDDINHDDLRQS